MHQGGCASMQIGEHLLMFLLSQNSFAFLFCHSYELETVTLTFLQIFTMPWPITNYCHSWTKSLNSDGIQIEFSKGIQTNIFRYFSQVCQAEMNPMDDNKNIWDRYAGDETSFKVNSIPKAVSILPSPHGPWLAVPGTPLGVDVWKDCVVRTMLGPWTSQKWQSAITASMLG